MNNKSHPLSDTDRITGRSPAIRKIRTQIRDVAAYDVPVLLQGETGTGKDLVAREIHACSNRSNQPFIEVNLSALPVSLTASELFGHEKGAFTGAVNRYKGAFEQADGGTILLNEIDTLEEKTQVSLLRLIEDKKFRRIGGETTIRTNVRIIAASNRNLSELSASGAFREDLFFRLDIFRITLPPLRDRHGDIQLLARNFVAQYQELFNKTSLRLSQECISRLENYTWPGNIRELQNVLKRAVLACKEDVLLPEHLSGKIAQDGQFQKSITFPVDSKLEMIEAHLIAASIAAVGNNRSKAAELLGISRRALYNKIQKYRIEKNPLPDVGASSI